MLGFIAFASLASFSFPVCGSARDPVPMCQALAVLMVGGRGGRPDDETQ